jgi:hypothetical protein
MSEATKAPAKPRRRKKTLAPVLVTMVLDRSGSMSACKPETIEAFNSYLDGLRRDPGETFVTLRQFDTDHDLLYEAVLAAEVAYLSDATFQPRGMTALNDAIGYGIADGDRAIAKLPADTKHLLVVLTDGGENASREHTPDSVKSLLAARAEDGWTVVFLQGNLDVQATVFIGATYGINAGNVAVYSSSVAGSTSATMDSMSAITSTMRSAPKGSMGASAFAASGRVQDYSNVEWDEGDQKWVAKT